MIGTLAKSPEAETERSAKQIIATARRNRDRLPVGDPERVIYDNMIERNLEELRRLGYDSCD